MILQLARARLLRKTVRALRLYRIANFYLRLFPIIKRSGKVTYRARFLESVPLSREMLEKGTMYPREKLPDRINSFVDLGCNVGYFACWLWSLANGRPLKGLMIDANKSVVEEAQWHAAANGWTEVFALHGLVGENAGGQDADFYLFSSNYCSSTMQNPTLQGAWKRVRVPCVSVGETWRQRFGEQRVDLLKVDVEGSELQFFQSERSFLRLVDVILVEWHKWKVQLPDLETLLATQGFKLTEILQEDERDGTCLFRRNER